MTTVSIIGAGAWGVALALVAERNHKKVMLYAHLPEEYESLKKQRETSRLPGVKIPANIHVTDDIASASQANIILIVVPAQAMRSAIQKIAAAVKDDSYVVVCAKGIEVATGLLMSDVIREFLPSHPVSVLSGPTFAREVALGLPAIASLASPEMTTSRWLASSLGHDRLRLYPSTDVIGLQVAGALKNVIAIASGIVTARHLGENARAAIIVRGLAEMTRLGVALGAEEETFQGPAGIGDLLLSATSPQSRNFSLGLSIGKEGYKQEDIGLTEGAFTARAVMKLANQLGVEMPICQAVCHILDHQGEIDKEISVLWSRSIKHG
jgi:glycerol-3-phosphate dehydrogenase (NAD(P)+)